MLSRSHFTHLNNHKSKDDHTQAIRNFAPNHLCPQKITVIWTYSLPKMKKFFLPRYTLQN